MQTIISQKPATQRALNLGSQYTLRAATNATDLAAAQSLRFQVFNLELNEGLAASYATGLDVDVFDAICDHLIVEHVPSATVVGTYRLQTGVQALPRGYYSEQEFHFAPYESLRSQLVELGRACVHPQHRNLFVLGMLWKGVAQYANERGARYLIGCSSLTSQSPALGAAAFAALREESLVATGLQTLPRPEFYCPLDEVSDEPVIIPKLLRGYLAMGAKICGPPALDRQFKTIDFLTLLDLETMVPAARQKFFGR